MNATVDLLPRSSKTHGTPTDYILDRTLLRPRDAIAFVNDCLLAGRGKSRLSWDDIRTAEGSYSKNRYLALRDEWKVSYPGVEKVLEVFRDAALPLSREQFTERLDEAMLLIASSDFPGTRWMTELSAPMWSAGAGDRDWTELYHPLVKFLFEIGLIGLASSRGEAPAYSSDDPEFAELQGNLESIRFVYIHPAFRPALNSKPPRATSRK